jgi:hypothetical protein
VRLRSPFTIHSVAAIASVVAVIIVSQRTFRASPSLFLAQVTPMENVEMGVEHASPLSLSLSISAQTGEGGIADMNHDAEETVYVSVPSDWTRREVRGAPLTDVIAEQPTFGFTRWHLPPGTTVSFAMERSPTSILFHNPSGVPVQVRLTRVDIEEKTIDRTNILVKDTPVHLW